MSDRKPEVWIALGYGPSDAEKLEGIVADLVRLGSAARPEDARRAIAAVTFQPTYPEKGVLAAMRFRKALKQRLRGAG